MRSLFVVVGEILRYDVIELAFIDHDEMIESLMLHRLRPSLGERVQIRSPRRQLDHLSTLRFKDRIEESRELRVSVADDVGHCQPLLGRPHAEIPRLLRDPHPGGM